MPHTRTETDNVIVCCRLDNPRSMDPLAMIQEIGFLGPMAVAEESEL